MEQGPKIEKSPKTEKNRAEKLREKGYQIEKVRWPENEPMQCEMCIDKEGNFEFYPGGWFIEGQFYCPKHKESALDLLEKIDKKAEERILEQKKIDEERIKSQSQRSRRRPLGEDK